MKTYHNHRAEPYFTFLKNGQKTIEGRVRRGKYQNVAAGDSIIVYDLEETESISTRVKRVATYLSFRKMLETEDYKKLLPDATSIDHSVDMYRRFYTPEQEAEFGVVAIEVEVIEPHHLLQ